MQKMENNLSFYKEVAINIFRQKGKLSAVKFLMEKRNSTHRDWNKGLLDCKNLLESWIENKDYIPDEIKLNEYDKLKEERDLLIDALENLVKFIEVNELADRERDIFYVKAKELLSTITK